MARTNTHDSNTFKVWVIRSGSAKSSHFMFLEESIVGLDDVGLGNLTALGASRDKFYEVYRELFPDQTRTGSAGVAGKFYRFLHEVRVNDVIVYPDSDKKVHVGIVAGPYKFVSSNTCQHQRRVRWSSHIEKDRLRIEVIREMGAARTFFEIKRNPQVFRTLAAKEE